MTATPGTLTLTLSRTQRGRGDSVRPPLPRRLGERTEVRGLLFFALLLAILPLRSALFFSPPAVAAGQWWRVFTHPFIHVTWYHALLDGAAFLLLWRSLERRRLLYIALPAAGSLLAALWFWPAINDTGLCGLSGVAHGLMTVSALEMINIKSGSGLSAATAGQEQPGHGTEAAPTFVSTRQVGWLCLALVTGKSIWEAATGTVFFSWLHFGLMGTPVAVSHLGGVLGGIVAFQFNQWRKS